MATRWRVLFVCLGNICRSPAAQAVMERFAIEAGVAERVHVESAGTGGWHVGDLADPRMRQAAARRGVAITSRARQFTAAAFDRFDLILAMDREVRGHVLALARSPDDRAKVRPFRSFDPARARETDGGGGGVDNGDEASGGDDLDVPDPYEGGPEGFEEVLNIVERTCRALLTRILAE